MSSYKRKMLTKTGSFLASGSECETNSEWDYDDVNSLSYSYQGLNPGNGAEKSLFGDDIGDGDVAEIMEWLFGTRVTPSVPSHAKSIGTDTLKKQLSVHTTATTGMSESWSSSANTTEFSPAVAAAAAPTRLTNGSVLGMPTTDDHLLGMGSDFLETPLQLLLLTDVEQTQHPVINDKSDNADVAISNKIKGKEDPWQQPKQQLVSSSKSIASSVFSVPSVLEIPQESLLSNTSRRSTSRKTHETCATTSIAPKEESTIPVITNHHESETFYKQRQHEILSSQKEISQQYLYLQEQQQQHIVQEMQTPQLQKKAFPSPEDEWHKANRSSEGASAKTAARIRRSSAASRRRSSAADRLLANSFAEGAFSFEHEAGSGGRMVNTKHSCQLGQDEEVKSTHSRCSSRFLTRERLNKASGATHSGFFETSDDLDDAAVDQYHRQQPETIRLDNRYYKSDQKRKSVFWRFFVVSWKVASFQWCGSYEHHDSKEACKKEVIIEV